jgi:hypothetical protein
LTEHILLPPTTKRRPSPWALALSALINLLFVLLLLYENWQWAQDKARLDTAARQIEVEVVPQPLPPPPPPQQPKPEQPKPEAPKPEPEQQKQPEKQPERPPEQRQLIKPPPPQLLQAPIKEKSATDRRDGRNGAEGENTAIALIGTGPTIQLFNKMEGRKGPEGSTGPIGEELSQSEQDYILSQILPYWKVDTHRPEGRGMVLEAIIEIRPDGFLMSPLNRDDPWNPGRVIAGYGELARLGYTYRREALEGFLFALRMSQPLRLPRASAGPRWMKLRFSFDDM